MVSIPLAAMRRAPKNMHHVARLVLSVLVFGMAVWWLFQVGKTIAVAPIREGDGAVLLDQYARAKDILLVVLPLLTLCLGYWFGVEGVAAAREAEREARDAAREAQQSAVKAGLALSAVLDSMGNGALKEATETFPEMFQ